MNAQKIPFVFFSARMETEKQGERLANWWGYEDELASLRERQEQDEQDRQARGRSPPAGKKLAASSAEAGTASPSASAGAAAGSSSPSASASSSATPAAAPAPLSPGAPSASSTAAQRFAALTVEGDEDEDEAGEDSAETAGPAGSPGAAGPGGEGDGGAESAGEEDDGDDGDEDEDGDGDGEEAEAAAAAAADHQQPAQGIGSTALHSCESLLALLHTMCTESTRADGRPPTVGLVGYPNVCSFSHATPALFAPSPTSSPPLVLSRSR